MTKANEDILYLPNLETKKLVLNRITYFAEGYLNNLLEYQSIDETKTPWYTKRKRYLKSNLIQTYTKVCGLVAYGRTKFPNNIWCIPEFMDVSNL